MSGTAACLVCRELSGEIDLPGGFLIDSDEIAAFHVPPVEELGISSVYLGHLLIVTKRHVAGLGELTDAEAAAVGVAAARLATALVTVGEATWVYSAVIGTGVPHFHHHLMPRYPETPPELPWYSVDEWDGARRGGSEKIAQLATRLKASLVDAS